MEQIHYIFKVRIIKYSIAVQKQKTYEKKKQKKKKINEEQHARTLTHEEQSVIIRNLTKQETALEKMEEHLARQSKTRKGY